MKAQTLFDDATRIKSETGKLKKAEAELNQLNDFLTGHKLGQLDQRLARKFIQGPQEALKDLYRDKIPAVNEYTGLRNDKDKMLDQMQIPSAPGPETLGWVRLAVDELYLFDFGQKVELNKERLEDYLDEFRFITDDPDILNAYNDLKTLAAQLKKINDKLKCFSKEGLEFTSDYGLGKIIALVDGDFKIQRAGFEKAIRLL